MLYERWREVCRLRAGETALRDMATGRSWTFRALDAAAESGDVPGPVACPVGAGADFVVAVLRAWRHDVPLCPLEPGAAPPAVPPPPAGVVHLKTTSGSTGAPKVIAFTAAQVAADADQIVSSMGLAAGLVNVGALSLAHSYGFSSLVTPLLLHGVPLVVAAAALPATVRAAVLAAGPEVVLPAVPALWRAWIAADAVPGDVRLAISAGAPLHGTLEHEAFSRLGVKIRNFLGASECGGIAFDRAPGLRAHEGEVGTAMDGVTLSLDDDGRLMVRGAAVGEGYWPTPSPELGGGIYRTGDLAAFDGPVLRLTGRVADLMNIAGRKLAPETVEAALRACPGVRECAVFGMPDAEDPRGEVVVAALDAPGLGPEALRAFAATRLAAWQAPRRWWFPGDLGTDGRGKLSRSALRGRYLAQNPPSTS
jgi:acyl-CoA synthetase (AMP-forming)/AMP-acid ligase II